jgi:hypothetical protein
MSMSNPALYHAVPAAVVQTGRNTALILRRDTGQIVEVSNLAARVLGLCRGYRTLEQHAAALGTAGVCADPRLIAETLDACARAGFLQYGPVSACVSRNEAQADRPRLSTVVVLSADRPGMLRRCLEALFGHCTGRAGAVRVIVVDGSRIEGRALANREVVAELSARRGWSLEYLGRREAAIIRGRLGSKGLPTDVLETGFVPGEIGAGRNLGMAATAGEDVVMVDDDVVCTMWALAEREEKLHLVGHEDLRRWSFFSNRAEALALARPVRVNLLDEHERLLSRLLESSVDESGVPVDASLACRHLVSCLEGQLAGVVKVSTAGLAGDSGMYCPSQLMFQPWSAARACGGDPRTAEAALRGREVHRIAAMPLITHDSSCMAYCTGFANSTILPPFMPMGRNEDGTFGAMLASCDESALFAHLPFGVFHDSERRSTYDGEPLRGARETRLSEFIMWAVRTAVAGVVVKSPVERMRRIGQSLADFARLRPNEFRDLVRDVTLVVRGGALDRIDRQLGSDQSFARCWARTYDSYRKAFVASVTSDSFFLPVEFAGLCDLADGYRAMQRFLGGFGGLIGVWPDVWAFCRDLPCGSPGPRE